MTPSFLVSISSVTSKQLDAVPVASEITNHCPISSCCVMEWSDFLRFHSTSYSLKVSSKSECSLAGGWLIASEPMSTPGLLPVLSESFGIEDCAGLFLKCPEMSWDSDFQQQKQLLLVDGPLVLTCNTATAAVRVCIYSSAFLATFFDSNQLFFFGLWRVQDSASKAQYWYQTILNTALSPTSGPQPGHLYVSRGKAEPSGLIVIMASQSRNA